MATDIYPESRSEEILVATINGEEYDKAPESRIEALLLELKEVIEEGGGGGGTTNYNLLQNKPSINGVTLTGDKSSEDLEIPTAADLAGKQDVLPVTASGNDVVFNGDIIDGQGNTLSVLAEALTKTASGNPIVITDCAGGKARSLVTTIEPIQEGEGDPSPTNIRPISGRNSVTVDDVGKNLLSLNFTEESGTSGSFIRKNADGSVTYKGTSDIETNIGNISKASFGFGNDQFSSDTVTLPVGTYILSGITNANCYLQLATLENGSASILGNTSTGDYQFTVTDPNKQYWVRIRCTTNTEVTIKPMIRRVDASADFEPYRETVSATIQLGTTVYGAEVDFDTGVVEVTDASYIFDGTETWLSNAPSSNSWVCGALDNVIKPNANNTTVAKIKSNRYKADTPNNIWTCTTDSTISVAREQDTYKIRVYDANAIGMTGTQAAEYFKDLQVCYELATPTTLQLTPAQLELLKGYNRVTVESGTITLDYVAKAISGNDEEIAPLVGDKATKSYAVNDFIERADGLYRVTASIASGASFTANNTVKMSIGEALTYLYNK